MQYSYRFIILICLIFSSSARAYEFFVDALYWRATETVDWATSNNLGPPQQSFTIHTIEFDYDPGFRVGFGAHGNWDTSLYYTKFYTSANATASGNMNSGPLAGRLFQGNHSNFFFNNGQTNFTINFNMVDFDLGKSFYLSDGLMIRPLLGLRGGAINQTMTTNLHGTTYSIHDITTNNFWGVGPKAAIETQLDFWCTNSYRLSIFSDFTTSYMWGVWNIRDNLNSNIPSTFEVNVGKRNFGAFALQAFIGAGLNYKCFAMKFGYEISDWFDQYQVLDDGTGAHCNDLILEGLTLRVMCNF